MESETLPDRLIVRQRKLDTLYRIIFFLTIAVVGVGVVGLFVQQYTLSNQINNEVTTIVDNQAKNREITDTQNSLVLGYLICIGKIQPQDRTDATINACVQQARSTDIQKLTGDQANLGD